MPWTQVARKACDENRCILIPGKDTTSTLPSFSFSSSSSLSVGDIILPIPSLSGFHLKWEPLCDEGMRWEARPRLGQWLSCVGELEAAKPSVCVLPQIGKAQPFQHTWAILHHHWCPHHSWNNDHWPFAHNYDFLPLKSSSRHAGTVPILHSFLNQTKTKRI